MDSAVLSLTCAGLGSSQEDEDGAVIGYAKSDHCLDNLKDLQRFLRRDDPQRREVFKQVCKWKIASRDLVPIIENYQTDRNLVITAVKVLVFLTMPVEPSSEDVAQQIEYLWDLKAALTRNVAVTVIVSLLEDPLDRLERTLFTEEDWKLVQLVLTLFRNVLAIQEITLPQKASGEATHLLFLADSFLELMFQENVMDLILVLTQHIDEPSGYLKQENLLLMEIYHYLFLGRDPGLIARDSSKDSKEQVNGDIDSSVDSLRLMMEEEERKKRMSRQRNSEHNSLSGTFTCFSVDGSKSLCKGNPTSTSANSLLKIRNVQRGPQKRIAWDNELLYIPKEGITEMLRSFLDQFLSGAYNILMQSICDDITNEHHSIEKSDISTFFKVARFVLAFQHEKASNDQKSSNGIQSSEVSPSNGHDDNQPFHGDICGPVGSTLNEDMFNIVISRWRETNESLKETNDYKTLSAAGSLMKTMIDMIYLVLKVLPEDSRESQTARVLLDLVDLLETIHIMLQLMEKLQARGALRECHCIDADTLLNELKKDGGNKNGETGSSKGWRGPINIADSLGDDEADLVIPQEPYDADKDGDLSGDEDGGGFRKSNTTYKRSRLVSLSDSEADENERNDVSRGSLNSEVPKRRGRSIFTEEQERLIRDLYEKYKDDRKCSHLIAEALDPTGKISSAQVSRKLTRLGLRNVIRRKKVADESLSTGDLATEPQHDLLDDLNHMLGEHNHDPKPKSSRTRRKMLHGSSCGHDDTSHGKSSDEETLQALKSRTKNNKPSSVDSLNASQHQEAQRDLDSDDATIGSMIRSGKKKRLSTSVFEGNAQDHQEFSRETNTNDSSPRIPLHEKTLENNYPDDETTESMLRSRKKKRLVMSNFSANIQEGSASLRNSDLHDEIIASNITDASLIHGPEAVDNGGNTAEAELLDDIEVELDNHENDDQGITDDVNITESGGTTNSQANQRAGLKRRHRLVIDNDDDDE
nr:unnamed protein product [Digitaria exilis]